MKSAPNPPVLVPSDCVGCEQCVLDCPGLVLEMDKAKARVVRGTWCIGCGHCGAVCPTKAIFPEQGRLDQHPKKGEAPAVDPERLRLLFRERRSVRRYLPSPVPEEMLERILDAGRFAPTGSNSQNVHYVLLTSADRIAVLREMTIGFYDKLFSRIRSPFGRLLLSLVAGRRLVDYLFESLPKVVHRKKEMEQGKDPLFFHAPVVMIAHAESWDTSSAFNCSVALYHCSLMAHTLGLGCCFNGFLVNAVNRSPKIKDWLSIPRDHQCYASMTLGFPDAKYLHLVHRDPPKVG